VHVLNNEYATLKTLEEIDFEIDEMQQFQLTLDGSQFLMFDSGPKDPIRCLVFSTEANLDYLGSYLHWYCDGTFDVPGMFMQLFTVHVIKNLPCLYASSSISRATTSGP
jgi:hypothetical protein